jgi:hypothetical protein
MLQGEDAAWLKLLQLKMVQDKNCVGRRWWNEVGEGRT